MVKSSRFQGAGCVALSLEGGAGLLSGWQEAGGGCSLQKNSRAGARRWDTAVPVPRAVTGWVWLEDRVSVEGHGGTGGPDWSQVHPKREAGSSSGLLHSFSCSFVVCSLWKTFIYTWKRMRVGKRANNILGSLTEGIDLADPVNGSRKSPWVPGAHLDNWCSSSFLRHLLTWE